MRNNKGITLIALVITIIVLLILAGVSIAMLSGDNSILQRSRESEVHTVLGAAKDAVSLYASQEIEEYYNAVYAARTHDTTENDYATVGAYLSTKLTNSNLATEIGNNSVSVTSTVTGTTGAGSITLVYNGYTTVGTVLNGKIDWGGITKNS